MNIFILCRCEDKKIWRCQVSSCKTCLKSSLDTRFYTQKPLHTHTHTLLDTEASTHKRFYTQTLLHTEVFTHRLFYTQKLLHPEASTHRRFYTQTPFHTNAFTNRRFYTQTLFTQTYLHRNFYTSPRTHAFSSTEAFTHTHTHTHTHLLRRLVELWCETQRLAKTPTTKKHGEMTLYNIYIYVCV